MVYKLYFIFFNDCNNIILLLHKYSKIKLFFSVNVNTILFIGFYIKKMLLKKRIKYSNCTGK